MLFVFPQFPPQRERGSNSSEPWGKKLRNANWKGGPGAGFGSDPASDPLALRASVTCAVMHKFDIFRFKTRLADYNYTLGGRMFHHLQQAVVSCQEAAYPTVVKLPNNHLICGYSSGGGANISGGTHWSTSTDDGASWNYGGMILPPQQDPKTANSLRLSLTREGNILAYGQRKYLEHGTQFGRCPNEAVFCTAGVSSMDWSTACIIPHSFACPVEVSNPIVELSDGRWLAPAALLSSPERLGEKVIAWESADKGASWENYVTVMADPLGKKGFFEQKVIETEPGIVYAFAWTVQLGSYRNLPNSFSFSEDSGRTWQGPFEMELNGQTMTPCWLGGNNFLLIYNYRNQPHGIKIAYVEITGSHAKIIWDEFLWHPQSARQSDKEGIRTLEDLAFGLPSLIRLGQQKFMAVFWAMDQGHCLIRSMTFVINSL